MIAAEPATEQRQWVEQLKARTTAAGAGAPAACILDTGVSRTHPLLAMSLDVADCHSADPLWGVDDRDGHGTEMAGLALYGDVGTALMSAGPVRLRHRLESVKILPRPGLRKASGTVRRSHRDRREPGRDPGAEPEARAGSGHDRPSRGHSHPGDGYAGRRTAVLLVGSRRRPRRGRRRRGDRQRAGLPRRSATVRPPIVPIGGGQRTDPGRGPSDTQ